MQLLIGFILALIIAYLAYRAESLSQSGAYAAIFVGAVVFGLGGWQWAVILLTFFITSSALSRLFKNPKQGLNEKYSKGDQRDVGQVLGNGGLATVFVLINLLYPGSTVGWVGFAAALAAVNADTWATELGVLNPTPPCLITDLRKRVEKGTSGGISLFGTLASLVGASAIALPAAWFIDDWTLLPLISLAGLAGSLFDSLLGATVQAMYHCPKENKETEKHPLHTCGTETVHIRGWNWLNNDWVNFACGAFGVAIACFLLLIPMTMPFWDYRPSPSLESAPASATSSITQVEPSSNNIQGFRYSSTFNGISFLVLEEWHVEEDEAGITVSSDPSLRIENNLSFAEGNAIIRLKMINKEDYLPFDSLTMVDILIDLPPYLPPGKERAHLIIVNGKRIAFAGYGTKRPIPYPSYTAIISLEDKAVLGFIFTSPSNERSFRVIFQNIISSVEGTVQE